MSATYVAMIVAVAVVAVAVAVSLRAQKTQSQPVVEPQPVVAPVRPIAPTPTPRPAPRPAPTGPCLKYRSRSARVTTYTKKIINGKEVYVPNTGLSAPQCEECAPGYTLASGFCKPTQPPTPAPLTPGFAPVAPPPPPPGYDTCSAGRVFDGRIGKCVIAPPPQSNPCLKYKPKPTCSFGVCGFKPRCETCAAGYDLVDDRCVARKPPTPAPSPTSCLAAARRVCVDKSVACGKRIAAAIARCTAAPAPTPAPRPVVPRQSRPMPGVPGVEIVEGGEAPLT